MALVAAGVVKGSRALFTDSYYDLYAGRYIIQHGIPRWNTVTVAAHGAPWTDQQWLAHAAYYSAWLAGGYPAVAGLSVALITLAYALLMLLMLRRGIPATRAFMWVIAAFAVGAGNGVIRAQSFAYALFAGTLWLIVADGQAGRPRRRTWLAIPLLVLWANTHGSVLLGAALVAGYAGYAAAKAGRRRDQRGCRGYLALGGAAAVAPLVTPYGLGIIGYYRVFMGSPAFSRYITEWAQPDPLHEVSWAFFALIAVAAIALVVAWRRGTRPDALLAGLAGLLLMLAFTAIRDQVWFGFAGSLLAADAVARSSAGRVPVLSKPFRRAVAGVLAGVALASTVVLARTTDRTFQSLVPVRAVGVAAAAAARYPASQVLGDEWTSAAMLWLHPAMFGRVGFDARLEQFTTRQFSAYADFLLVHGPRWDRVMAGYEIAVVSRVKRPQLAGALTGLPGWQVVYQDRDGLVLVRRGPWPARGGRAGPAAPSASGCMTVFCAAGSTTSGQAAPSPGRSRAAGGPA